MTFRPGHVDGMQYLFVYLLVPRCNAYVDLFNPNRSQWVTLLVQALLLHRLTLAQHEFTIHSWYFSNYIKPRVIFKATLSRLTYWLTDMFSARYSLSILPGDMNIGNELVFFVLIFLWLVTDNQIFSISQLCTPVSRLTLY